jgi:hypothetical protein
MVQNPEHIFPCPSSVLNTNVSLPYAYMILFRCPTLSCMGILCELEGLNLHQLNKKNPVICQKYHEVRTDKHTQRSRESLCAKNDHSYKICYEKSGLRNWAPGNFQMTDHMQHWKSGLFLYALIPSEIYIYHIDSTSKACLLLHQANALSEAV